MARPEFLSWRDTIMPMLGLFSSLGTLVCCVLPLVLVSLGMGAALVGLVSAAPWLVWLSAHKGAVFMVSGILLLVSGITVWRQRFTPCPVDPRLAAACRRLRVVSRWTFTLALSLWAVGFTVALVLPRILL